VGDAIERLGKRTKSTTRPEVTCPWYFREQLLYYRDDWMRPPTIAAVPEWQEVIEKTQARPHHEIAKPFAEDRAMKRADLLKKVESSHIKPDIADFDIGDQVEVHQRILEGTKERIQIFSGTVISRRSEGTRASFTVRRIVQGEGVERTFPLHSPKIAKIEMKRTGKVRRAKLYYLRDRVGKATRLRERRKGLAETTAADGKGKGKGKEKVAGEAKTGT
jgi:large subunit ribosomal protein L19